MTRKLISLAAVLVAFAVGTNDAEARHCGRVRNRCCYQNSNRGYNNCNNYNSGWQRNAGCGTQQGCNVAVSQPCCNATTNQATYYNGSPNATNAAVPPMAPSTAPAPAPVEAPVPSN